jgi:T4 RnlA family RNA ligase
MKKINKILLDQMMSEGYVHYQKHPTQDLFIYNYTQSAQYSRVWNEVTLMCRGLIMDSSLNIIARPFPKFFNLGEFEGQVIPESDFEVYEKMDGSLGILYWAEDKPFIATRGSFTSDQAVKASELLHTTYANTLPSLSKEKTYLFEIIYPENKIVVDYGQEESLVLLAIIDTATGADLPLEDIGFPIVKKYDGIKDIKTLKSLEQANKEGFVLKYSDGYRLKVKFEEYLRLHRIITQVSTISIWEHLRNGQVLDPIIDQVPDEFFNWVKTVEKNLIDQYMAIEALCISNFKIMEDRKATAQFFMTLPYPPVLFAMLDKKDYSTIIWKYLRPLHQKPSN